MTAWSLTPWLAFASGHSRDRPPAADKPIAADEHINWDIWGNSRHDDGPLWRTFLTEQARPGQRAG